ncbi:MAG: type I glyceraldehyde-3-phosphate dehydrogenase [Desulfobacteraceae bacterium]|nr:MAG: type I glyceraldehyde-3-phosphate dehydrogenase [Desulfobacteraceae bacterium]
MTIKLAINGLGRIGRLVFRSALKRSDIEIVAVNDLMDPESIAHLLSYDSTHGKLNFQVTPREKSIEINGKSIAVFSERDPANLPWRKFSVDIAAECTGLFRDKVSASKHMQGGAKKVIISAPAKDPDVTIVLGVNTSAYDAANHHIISNASCTTNCLAPVAKVLNDEFNIVCGLMTTVHSYTGDQRLLDAPHKDLRRARSACLSMIPTTTGAAKAVGIVLPELNGKLNGLSIRVPTPNVSLVDLVATINKSGVSAAEVNAALKHASENSLAGILGYSELPLVSSDYNGCTLSSVVDAPTTYIIKNMVKVLSWYDNEAGYSERMVDLIQMIGQKL